MREKKNEDRSLWMFTVKGTMERQSVRREKPKASWNQGVGGEGAEVSEKSVTPNPVELKEQQVRLDCSLAVLGASFDRRLARGSHNALLLGGRWNGLSGASAPLVISVWPAYSPITDTLPEASK